MIYLTDALVKLSIQRMKGVSMQYHDPNIQAADLFANLFVLVCLCGWIVYLVMT